jgi:hypothetical protein
LVPQDASAMRRFSDRCNDGGPGQSVIDGKPRFDGAVSRIIGLDVNADDANKNKDYCRFGNV